jgi:hypothetical protein
MSEGVFLLPRVSAPDANSCRQFARTTGFGTTGVVISNKPGRLYAVTFVNKAATAYFAQLHNKAFAPVATNVPVWEDILPVSSSVTIDFGVGGFYCSTGLSLGLSSTGGVLTVAGADNAVAYALFATDVKPPTITAIAPVSGGAAGGTAITITGTGFGGATSGTLGGVALATFVVVSDTSITAVTGAHAAGLVDCTITGVGESGTGKGIGLFTYT